MKTPNNSTLTSVLGIKLWPVFQVFIQQFTGNCFRLCIGLQCKKRLRITEIIHSLIVVIGLLDAEEDIGLRE
ncbi:MAG: hypothetical protein K6F94_00545 [Bacteroidaceae bacterium]|nr:hypothetical protein [Bacteroidaceae bacterium]